MTTTYTFYRTLTFDERHDHRLLCPGCGRHLVTPMQARLSLGCAWGRAVVGRWGVVWPQPDREVCE